MSILREMKEKRFLILFSRLRPGVITPMKGLELDGNTKIIWPHTTSHVWEIHDK